ncbi:MAG TPA: phosphoenolpyruvate carboxykinase (ATP) [bacterium]|nr:phosphoenolpyruvate carboxykinase (ATP) [bacterium]HPS29324.1 phosphoenolpyruvate carboxykinase (ATP) [bacterium]
MDFQKHINELISTHSIVQMNMSRELLIYNAVSKGKALITEKGALATWTPIESTGRSPKDTLIVKHPESAHKIDWHSPSNRPLEPHVFDMIFEDAIRTLRTKKSFYVNDRVLGADSSYALPVRVITDKAFTSVFVDNMFRPVPEDIEKSIFFKRPFTVIAIPYNKLDQVKYTGKLRKMPDGKTSDMVIAVDFDRSIGIVFGSAYLGSVKKLMFTVMNYYLPEHGILPLHCSANEGPDGRSALMLGLSGTGKTTLSADPERALIGDDEHGWNDEGVANFENGIYAKLINLKKEKEPEIYNAIFHEADYLQHGALIENCMMYPDGVIDLDDERLTPNSRASFPLSFLTNVKPSAVSGHPTTIIFLTADANGVLPPVAKLTREQAMLWFLMGYTSKLAGTETGVKEPASTFSRFFGEPFMPRNPNDYIELLGKKMEEHGVSVYLVNTGWSGGPYGTGHRMDINITRKIISACLNGSLEKVKYVQDNQFHLEIPETCPGVDSNILNPVNTWENKASFNYRAEKLAEDFSTQFDAAYGLRNIPEAVRSQCPGK